MYLVEHVDTIRSFGDRQCIVTLRAGRPEAPQRGRVDEHAPKCSSPRRTNDRDHDAERYASPEVAGRWAHGDPSHMCYSPGMSNVGARELRNETRSVLERVEHGEPVTITVGGRPVATLEPIRTRAEFAVRSDFIRAVIERQADPALTADRRALAPDTTDDLPVP